MYMPDAKDLRQVPNVYTYIPLKMGMKSKKKKKKKKKVHGRRKKFASPNAKDTNMLVSLRQVTQKYYLFR